MRFSAANLLAFASAVLAQTANFDVVNQPTKNSVVPAGKTFTIVWSPSAKYNEDTITLALLGGPTPQTLQEVSVIKSGLDSGAGKYEWAVAPALGADATYGIRITLDSDPSIMEYSFPFTISSKSTGSATSDGSSNSGAHLAESSAAGTIAATTKTTASSSTSTSSSSKTTVSTTSSKTTTSLTSTFSSVSSAPTTLKTSKTSKTMTTQTLTSTMSRSTTTKPASFKTETSSTHTSTGTVSAASSKPTTVSTSDAKSLSAGLSTALAFCLVATLFAL
ncbi:hypothetical protein SEPCBS119000_002166 [Sporothrix epigloea]|uniref:Yeast cell wall synthesis Kre9/Knh1-like N-terminal domain-containing protein n=1 Tax=Sporothrix epigloea TaxID=1892477 RepID=A0ABP0DEQ0_9PEZI